MLIKSIGWLLAALLLVWLLGILLALIPVIFFLILTAVASLFLYSLFPDKFRIHTFEQWLGIKTKKLKTVPVDALPLDTTSGNSPSSDEERSSAVEDGEANSTTTTLKPPTISQPQQKEELIQPELQFDTINYNKISGI